MPGSPTLLVFETSGLANVPTLPLPLIWRRGRDSNAHVRLNTGTLDFQSSERPVAQPLRYTKISDAEILGLTVAIGTSESQILRTIVPIHAVLVIHLENQRCSVPLRWLPAHFTNMRTPNLKQTPTQNERFNSRIGWIA